MTEVNAELLGLGNITPASTSTAVPPQASSSMFMPKLTDAAKRDDVYGQAVRDGLSIGQ
jgi:hypothetical protein